MICRHSQIPRNDRKIKTVKFFFWLSILKLRKIHLQFCSYTLLVVFKHLYSHTLKVAEMAGWCWVNFQCRDVLLILIIVGQGPTALTVRAGEDCLDFFLSSIISLFFLPLSRRRPNVD